MMHIKYFKGLICLLTATALGACHADHNHEEEGHDHQEETLSQEHNEGHEEHTDGKIVIEPEQAKRSGIVTEKIRKGTFHAVLKVSGTLSPALGTEATVVASTAGIVQFKTTLNEGTAIRKGQSMMHLSAKDLENGDPIEKLKLDLENARLNMERAQKLAAKQIVSQKEMEEAKLRYDLARTAYEGVAAKRVGQGLAVTAPQNGYIKQILVRQGDYVTVGQPLAVITQDRKLELRAEVGERHSRFLNQIATAHFRTAASDSVISLQQIHGQLKSVGKALTDGNFYIPVTFEMDHEGEMVPGSFAEIWLIGQPQEQILTIPVSALTEEQGLYFVYVKEDEEHYRKEEVLLGDGDGQRVAVIKGLHEGEDVVVQGAVAVRLASQSGIIPEGHNHNH